MIEYSVSKFYIIILNNKLLAECIQLNSDYVIQSTIYLPLFLLSIFSKYSVLFLHNYTLNNKLLTVCIQLTTDYNSYTQ